MKRTVLVPSVLTLAVAGMLIPPGARAQEGGGAAKSASVGGSVELGGGGDDGEDARDFRFELGLFGGAHLFASDHGLGRYSDDPETISPDHGGVFGARFGLNLAKLFTLEGELGALPTRTRNDATSLFILAYRANLLMHLMSEGPFRPFVLGGLGGLTSIVGDESVVDGDSDGELHVGLGAKILLGERIGLRVDGRVTLPPAFASGVAKVGDETLFGGPDFEILASLFVGLGEIARPVKAPPPPPPPPPPPDPDGDGIVGDADKCPTDPEDKDGFEDDDGCPDPDNDADGIPDAADKCPLKPENRNGVDDQDGCPEEDTDGDGFFGSQDKCPDAPETKNGYQDDDGCPDEVPPAVKKFTGVIEGINYKTNSAEILKGSFAILDRAVKVLQEYPDVRLEIGGHTDNRGKPEYNKSLSERRAQSVRTYLVSKGVAAERLTAVGYGLERPIADNATSAGRAKNRRTEFQLISGGPGN